MIEYPMVSQSRTSAITFVAQRDRAEAAVIADEGAKHTVMGDPLVKPAGTAQE